MSISLDMAFRDILNSLCPCSIEAATTTQYFLWFDFYNASRSALIMIWVKSIVFFLHWMKKMVIDWILYGGDKLDDKKNHNVLMFPIKFIKDSQIFDFFRIGVFSFNVFSFSPTEIYIYSVGYCYIFFFNFSFCVKNGLEKKQK